MGKIIFAVVVLILNFYQNYAYADNNQKNKKLEINELSNRSQVIDYKLNDTSQKEDKNMGGPLYGWVFEFGCADGGDTLAYSANGGGKMKAESMCLKLSKLSP